MKSERIGWFLVFVLILIFIVYLTQILWNWLVPELFNGPYISYLQAAGLMLLFRLLVWLPKGGGYYSKYHSKHLSEEDKAELKKKFMEKCGWNQPKEPENKSE